jgi:hypothetical protein
MIQGLETTRNELLADLAKRKLEVTTDAMKPLQRIDFRKLVKIYDHEEHFLRTQFLSSLVTAHKTRLRTSNGTAKINAHDVRTAMLMLGTAVASASEQTFSKRNKSIIKEVCPYC